jgi:carbamoyltransferase
MYILGIATMGESAAALLKDGEVCAAVEEERFTRVKHEGCFPLRSIDYCLAQAGITLSDVDHIGVYWQPWRVLTRVRGVLATALSSPRRFGQKLGRSLREFSPNGGGTSIGRNGSWLELCHVRGLLEQQFGRYRGRIHYLDHHLCHMASAFFASSFEEATIVVFDGAGEDASTTLAVGSGTRIEVLRTIPWPHSLGHFYSAMTGFLGFEMLDGEYKMMGLAPYAKPDHLQFIRRRVLVSDRPGSFRLNSRVLDYHEAFAGRFSPELVEHLGKPRQESQEPFAEQHQRIASSAQAAFEDVVSDLAHWAYDAGGRKKNLCIAGGCGLNCTANGRLIRDGLFECLYVPPAPHDAGAALGAALLIHHQVLGRPRGDAMRHAFYGPAFTDAQVSHALAAKSIRSVVLDEGALIARTADSLTAGRIVGWFQGRAEFGPRALGGRSFLADPRDESIREVLNAKIKKRELFRPFAPSVKEEAASEYFDLAQPSPFMNIAAPARSSARSRIPAVVHVDGSARVQTVSRDQNARYWMLLDRFEARTGVPVLLNTSFNIQEPIVCTPEQALDTFLRSGVDALVIGNHFVDRDQLGDPPEDQA